MLNALTIDVEDYFQVSAFEPLVERRHWDRYPSRVAANTRRLLRLLDRRQTRATFFVLGWVAARQQELVREIVRAGHEIGSHSYWHRLVYTLTPEEFREDLTLARNSLEDAAGTAVTAFRAASFSITQKSLWALDILAEEGYQVDSSIFPVYHHRYGIPRAERFPHVVAGRSGEIWEFPPSVFRLGGFNLPVAGGGYFRLFPRRWTGHCVRRLNARRRPFVFYVHPWELDPEQPRLPAGWSASWRHYHHLADTEQKLDWLLRHFSFGSLSDVRAAMLTDSQTADRTPAERAAADYEVTQPPLCGPPVSRPAGQG